MQFHKSFSTCCICHSTVHNGFVKTSLEGNIRLFSGKHQKQNILGRMHIFSLLHQNTLFFGLPALTQKALDIRFSIFVENLAYINKG